MSVETSYVYDYDNPDIEQVQATDEFGEPKWEAAPDGSPVYNEDGSRKPVFELDENGNIKTTTSYHYKKDPETQKCGLIRPIRKRPYTMLR